MREGQTLGHHAETRSRLPSWAASLLLHALLLTTVAWAFSSRAPRGAAADNTREVGIVLRQQSRDALMLDAELTTPLDAQPTEAPDPLDLSHAAPAAPAESPFADLVDELTAEGPAPSEAIGAEGVADGPGGRPTLPIGQTRTEVFGVEGVGSRFVYAFDRSISMRGAPLAAAKRELAASLAPLEPTHQFHILFFNHRIAPFDLGRRGDHFATEEIKRLAADFIRGVTADGSTDREGVLSRALRLGPDVVFFLTDSDSPMTETELAKVARLNDRVGATICTIEFGVGPSRGERNFLVRLAETTGGQYGYVDTDMLTE